MIFYVICYNELEIIFFQIKYGIATIIQPKYHNCCICFNLVYLNFDKTEYTVYEDDGLLEVVLVLDKEADNNFTIQVMDDSNNATSE